MDLHHCESIHKIEFFRGNYELSLSLLILNANYSCFFTLVELIKDTCLFNNWTECICVWTIVIYFGTCDPVCANSLKGWGFSSKGED